MIRGISEKLIKIDINISEEQKKACLTYIKGAVYGYCNALQDSTEVLISVRRLFGGDNNNWMDTPLNIIYTTFIDKYQTKCEDSKKVEDKAFDMSAKVVGKLLKNVLIQDKREYEHISNDTGNVYKLCK